jgi:FtsZ-interacting cell division protein ZipA
MFGFIKFIIGLVAVVGLAYVTFFVNLGDKTLYQHGVSISKTDEAKELESGIKTEAENISRKVKIEIKDTPETPSNTPERPATKAKSDAQEQNRESLEALIRSKLSDDEEKDNTEISARLTPQDKQLLNQLLSQKSQ